MDALFTSEDVWKVTTNFITSVLKVLIEEKIKRKKKNKSIRAPNLTNNTTVRTAVACYAKLCLTAVPRWKPADRNKSCLFSGYIWRVSHTRSPDDSL